MSSVSTQELWSIYCQPAHHLSSEDVSIPKVQAQFSHFLFFFFLHATILYANTDCQVAHIMSCLLSISVQIFLLLTVFDCDLLRTILLPTKSVLTVFEKGICDYHHLTLPLYFVSFHLCISLPILSLVIVFI